MARLTRRRLIGGSLATGAAAGLHAAIPHSHPWDSGAQAHAAGHEGHAVHAGHTDGHATFRGGPVDNRFDPHAILRDFDWGTTRRLAGGRVLREWQLVASDMEVEVAPGVHFPAWTYNDRIPGPTLRAREGERLRVTFLNGSEHPHTIHWHGLHPAAMDGVAGGGLGQIPPGGKAVYEFDAEPFGVHLYHCHVRPLAEHIAKGLYGAFIIDPKEPRPDADELVMVMNGFDTNFDRQNEIYAVNTVGFAYMDDPVVVQRDSLTRIYLVNVLEYDLINSFHVHGNFFDWYPTGTSKTPVELTDTVMLCQGQRGILELRFPNAGRFMFHAHQSEFTELGWQGFFQVRD
jgi:FtsP/CotA-like multicopper oxidase with cupredoxin domain